MCLILMGQRLFEVQMTVTRGYLSYHIYGTVDVLQLLSVGRARRGQRFRDRLCCTRTQACVRAPRTDSTSTVLDMERNTLVTVSHRAPLFSKLAS